MPSTGLRTIGLVRIAYGAYVLTRPKAGAVSWLGATGDGAGQEVLMRCVGTRDAAIGLALVTGFGDQKTLAKAAVALDLGDLVATVAGRGIPKAQLAKVVAVIGAYAGVTAALVLREG